MLMIRTNSVDKDMGPEVAAGSPEFDMAPG